MKRLLVLCEGQTEESFFNLVLREHLAHHGVFASCTLICTAREEGRRVHRGGHAHRWDLIARDLRLLLLSKPDAVTTMLDLYAFPGNMPGFPEAWPVSAAQRAEVLGAAFAKAVNDPRFIPGLLVHEFEGLLFAGPAQVAEVAVVDPARRSAVEGRLRTIAKGFTTPEEIDNGPTTAPSKRILDEVPGYRKPRHGPTIAQRIGLSTLRAQCPLFGGWLARLEALGQ